MLLQRQKLCRRCWRTSSLWCLLFWRTLWTAPMRTRTERCLLSHQTRLLSHHTCLLSRHTCLLSHHTCLLSRQTCLLSHHTCLLSCQTCLLSRQTRLLSHHTCLLSRQHHDQVPWFLLCWRTLSTAVMRIRVKSFFDPSSIKTKFPGASCFGEICETF